MSNPLCQNGPMKNILHRLLRQECRVIATFGQAQLVSTPEGRLELRGGTADDRLAAREWISLFMHEAAPRLVPAR